STELVCGALIAVGLATRPAAVMLCGVMTVAIVTAAAPEKHITLSWHGLLDFFYRRRSCSSSCSPGSPSRVLDARVSTPGSLLAVDNTGCRPWSSQDGVCPIRGRPIAPGGRPSRRFDRDGMTLSLDHVFICPEDARTAERALAQAGLEFDRH